MRGGRVSFRFSPSPLSQDHVLSFLSSLKQFIVVCPGSWVNSVGVVTLMSGEQRFNTQPLLLKSYEILGMASLCLLPYLVRGG